MTRTMEAIAVRDGDRWAIEVPGVPGAFSQASRLDQVAEMAADAVLCLTGERVRIVVRAQAGSGR